MSIRPLGAGLAAAAAVGLVVAAVTGVLDLGVSATDRPPAPPPAALATEPAPAAPVTVSEPGRFRVELVSTKVRGTGNEHLFRRRPGGTGQRAADRAAADATRALSRYLDAAFLRGGEERARAIRRLLTTAAADELTPESRRALALNAGVWKDMRKGAARVRAVALHERGTVSAVTLRYRAVVRPRGPARATVQDGVMVFLPKREGWKADLVAVRLAGPADAEASS